LDENVEVEATECGLGICETRIRLVNIGLYSSQFVLWAGLRSALSGSENFTLSTACPGEDHPIDLIRKAPCPDVVMIDVMAGTTLEELLLLRSAVPMAALILWVENPSREFISQAMALRITGILTKSSPIELVLTCLDSVAKGKFWIDNELNARLMFAERTNLTARQRELMALLARGLRNKEIAWRLGITEGTVKVHLNHLFRKVGVRDRFELALVALRNLPADRTGAMEHFVSGSVPSAPCQPGDMHPVGPGL
jgi:two-component system nitrate/nitrite response regulator NarL